MPNHLMEFIPAIYRGINIDNYLPCLEAADWIEEQGAEAWARQRAGIDKFLHPKRS